jgi:hypothetical protein
MFKRDWDANLVGPDMLIDFLEPTPLACMKYGLELVGKAILERAL